MWDRRLRSADMDGVLAYLSPPLCLLPRPPALPAYCGCLQTVAFDCREGLPSYKPFPPRIRGSQSEASLYLAHQRVLERRAVLLLALCGAFQALGDFYLLFLVVALKEVTVGGEIGSLGWVLVLMPSGEGHTPPLCHWACFLVPPLEFCPQHTGLLFIVSGLRLPLLIMPRALPVSLGSFSHLFPFSFLPYLP